MVWLDLIELQSPGEHSIYCITSVSAHLFAHRSQKIEKNWSNLKLEEESWQSIVVIGQNTEKSPRGLSKIANTQTP